MGYDFKSHTGDTIYLGSPDWQMVRRLAELHGWQPQGTLPPDDHPTEIPWAGKYTGNNAQRVAAADAEELAIALESALSGFDFVTVLDEINLSIKQQLEALSTSTAKVTIDLVSEKEYRCMLLDFVAFCHKGEFVIG